MTTLRYDRLDDGTLVALASHEGRSVAAIVHAASAGDSVYDQRRWTIAGDVDLPRPEGSCHHLTVACAEAAKALGESLGIVVDGYEVGR